MSREETKLLPCPFCGGPADFEECPQGSSVSPTSCTWSVGCQNGDEDCIGYQMLAHYNRKSEAAAAWNKRATGVESADTITALRAEVAALRAQAESKPQDMSKNLIGFLETCDLRGGSWAKVAEEVRSLATPTAGQRQEGEVLWCGYHPNLGYNLATMADSQQGATSRLMMAVECAANRGWEIQPLYALPQPASEASSPPRNSDAWMEQAAKWLEQKADLATNSLHCGDNAMEIGRTHNYAAALKCAATALRSSFSREEQA